MFSNSSKAMVFYESIAFDAKADDKSQAAFDSDADNSGAKAAHYPLFGLAPDSEKLFSSMIEFFSAP
jgi:hypothetical protein